MKIVLLAGGLGTRISEYTNTIPKPMIQIGGKPILWHLMQIYAKHSYIDFILAVGYKSEVIKDFFLNYKALNDDFTIELGTGKIQTLNHADVNWKVTVVNTGEATMTGGRVLRLKDLIGSEPFMLTYGDALANVNIPELLKFHKAHKKMITMTAVRPAARFGELELNQNSAVTSFKEKPQLGGGWINGGFFVVDPKFLDLIKDDSTVLEREPLETAAKLGELMAFKHEGFWQCMDTKREHEILESMCQNREGLWSESM